MSLEAAHVGFPAEVWLGKKRGQWPIQAFPDEAMAMRWASDASIEEVRYVIGPVLVEPTLTAREAVKIPESFAWKSA